MTFYDIPKIITNIPHRIIQTNFSQNHHHRYDYHHNYYQQQQQKKQKQLSEKMIIGGRFRVSKMQGYFLYQNYYSVLFATFGNNKETLIVTTL